MTNTPIRESAASLPDPLDVREHREFLPCKMWLNGEMLKQCFRASIREGWADCYKVGPNGNPYIANGGLAHERLHGKVEIKRMESSDGR